MKKKIYAILGMALFGTLYSCAHQSETPIKILVTDMRYNRFGITTILEHTGNSYLPLKLAQRIEAINKTDDNKKIQVQAFQYKGKPVITKAEMSQINGVKPDILIELETLYDERTKKTSNSAQLFFPKQNKLSKQAHQLSDNLFECLVRDGVKATITETGSYSRPGAEIQNSAVSISYLSDKSEKDYLMSEQGQNELAHNIYTCLKNYGK